MFDTELYAELQAMLQDAGLTLGGAETLNELLELCEEQFGDIV